MCGVTCETANLRLFLEKANVFETNTLNMFLLLWALVVITEAGAVSKKLATPESPWFRPVQLPRGDAWPAVAFGEADWMACGQRAHPALSLWTRHRAGPWGPPGRCDFYLQ